MKQRKDRKDETTVDDFVNEKLSKQILTQARLRMQDLHRETVGEPIAKKLPKLGDNLDSDEDDDEDDEEVGTDDYEKSNVFVLVILTIWSLRSHLLELTALDQR